MKIQEEVENQQNLKAKEKMDQLVKQKTQIELEEEKRMPEDARKIQLMENGAELQLLEHKSIIQLRDSSENKENEGTFHDLKHWMKSLSGVT